MRCNAKTLVFSLFLLLFNAYIDWNMTKQIHITRCEVRIKLYNGFTYAFLILCYQRDRYFNDILSGTYMYLKSGIF